MSLEACPHRTVPVTFYPGPRPVSLYKAPDVGDVRDLTTGAIVPLRATTSELAAHLLAEETGAVRISDVDVGAYARVDDFPVSVMTWAPLPADHPAVVGTTSMRMGGEKDQRLWRPVTPPFKTYVDEHDGVVHMYPNEGSPLGGDWFMTERNGCDTVCGLALASEHPARFARDWWWNPAAACCPDVPAGRAWVWPVPLRKHLWKKPPDPPVTDTARAYIDEIVAFRVEHGRFPHSKGVKPDGHAPPDHLGEGRIGHWLGTKRKDYRSGRLGKNLLAAIEAAGIPLEPEGSAGRDNEARHWTLKHGRPPSARSKDPHEVVVARWARSRKLDLTVPPVPFTDPRA